MNKISHQNQLILIIPQSCMNFNLNTQILEHTNIVAIYRACYRYIALLYVLWI